MLSSLVQACQMLKAVPFRLVVVLATRAALCRWQRHRALAQRAMSTLPAVQPRLALLARSQSQPALAQIRMRLVALSALPRALAPPLVAAHLLPPALAMSSAATSTLLAVTVVKSPYIYEMVPRIVAQIPNSHADTTVFSACCLAFIVGLAMTRKAIGRRAVAEAAAAPPAAGKAAGRSCLQRLDLAMMYLSPVLVFVLAGLLSGLVFCDFVADGDHHHTAL